ncbi:NAD(P)/FAD-dependent oxidoreductase [Rhodoligotrophos defluvii]|uniref:NAD(P)/FAD-dependent oxidoreductase n=1 Tax=Rhodoligotrophos defluvii TaxID=2561934 RepID=UPI001485201F|nr:FAD-binding oxidoreductase [Rhodoligotrophos defluvii]
MRRARRRFGNEAVALERPQRRAHSAGRIFSPGFRAEPYWWDAAPLRREEIQQPLPQSAEIVIVGSGFTGLSAALTLARAGRDVVILDQDSIGAGASTRNFGMLGRQYKYDLLTLISRFGIERAKTLYAACNEAFAFVNALIEREGIDCFHAPSGRFVAANTPAHFDALEKELAARRELFGHQFHMVRRAEQGEELGTAQFVGGAVIPEHRMVHPGLFHRGLSERVARAGASFHAQTRVVGIERQGAGWLVQTDRGPIAARELIVATNGYTGSATPWLRRRIVPIRAYMIATEPLDPALLASVLPSRRGFHDCARDMQYARISPDGTRLLFGAMTGEQHDDLTDVAAALHRRMLALFPQLGPVRLSHVWTGQCGGTFDFFPHRGQHEGMHYALGYCFGAGMPFGTYLGDAVARGILGEEAVTALDFPTMPTNPLYWGRPWFLPFYLRFQKWLDWRDGARVVRRAGAA